MTSSKNSSIRRNEEESFLSFTIPSPFRRSEILPYWDDIVSFPGLTTGVADSPITPQHQSNKPILYFRQPFYNTCNTNRQDRIIPPCTISLFICRSYVHVPFNHKIDVYLLPVSILFNLSDPPCQRTRIPSTHLLKTQTLICTPTPTTSAIVQCSLRHGIHHWVYQNNTHNTAFDIPMQLSRMHPTSVPITGIVTCPINLISHNRFITFTISQRQIK